MIRNKVRNSVLIILIFTFFQSCNNGGKNHSNVQILEQMHLNKSNFEDTIQGKSTDLYIIKNSEGMSAAFTNYGGRLVSLLIPDKDGKLVDVVDGMGSIKDYQESTEPYFGATIGRYGNRIAKGEFTLNGATYHLSINNGPNTLHGGKDGFQYRVFDADQPDDSTIVFTLLSKDGDQGFPGNLNVKVTYSLTAKDGLKMVYDAETDKPTVINLTNHAFFNLNGEGSGTILNHSVWINANEYLPTDSTAIPFGKPESVQGTPFDFLTAETIGKRIGAENQQLKFGKGYDHNYVLNKADSGMTHAATVVGDKSGIQMDIYTDQPGLQFYSGNYMFGKNTFKNGTKDEPRSAFAMETQHFPDSPNEPGYPSTELKPGERYHTESIYRFSVEK